MNSFFVLTVIFVTSAPFNAFYNPEGTGFKRSNILYKIIVHNV
jgi:hypothetical protein